MVTTPTGVIKPRRFQIDAEMDKTPQDIIDILGFDPLEMR
jgi:hypothetical protein